MKADKTSRTAQYMALLRALEATRHPADRLFTDPYAVYFLDAGLKFTVWLSKISFLRNIVQRFIRRKIPGALSSGLARTKYIDDQVIKALNGVEQVIILGAGFDMRALRLEQLRSMPVIEIDHPNTSAFKLSTLKNIKLALSSNVTYCQIDFNKTSLEQLAAQQNFNFNRKAIVIWEGVTNYLSPEAIANTFRFISRFGKGSLVIFTYVHREILENPGAFLGGPKLLRDLEALDERWTFGFLPDELPGYLKQFDFSVIEDLGATEYRKMYLPARSERGYEFYRVAVAKKN